VNSSHQNKDTSSHNHTSGNECFLSLISKLHSTINTLISLIFYSQLTQYIYSTSSKLITVQFLLFVKSQFTTDAQNILDLNQCTPGRVCSWTDYQTLPTVVASLRMI